MPRASPPPRDRCRASGVRMHQRLVKSSAKPEFGPDCSVPATGWPGMKCTPGGICGPTSRTTARLDRADIGDDGAGLQRRRDLRGDRSAGADRHAQDDEIGILHRRRGTLMDRSRRDRCSFARARVASALFAWPAMWPASFSRRITWQSDEPMRPRPISATRSKCGALTQGTPSVRRRRRGWLPREPMVRRSAAAAHRPPCAAARCRAR